MNLFQSETYYCKHCKSVHHTLDDLFFVEEGSPISFCSEACIEKFYDPIVTHYNKLLDKFRADLKIQDEAVQEYLEDGNIIQKHMSKPDEIYRIENQLKEELYVYSSTFSKNDDTFDVMSLLLVFDKKPAFVFAITATQNDFLKSAFKKGEKIESIEEFYNQQMASELAVDESVIEEVEHKKNTMLAEHLTLRKDSDISFENFDLYADCLSPTLESYDELYCGNDEEGDEIYTYIKSFEKNGISFFYIIICQHQETEDDYKIVLPILSFPTIDGDLCGHYRNGSQISGNLPN